MQNWCNFAALNWRWEKDVSQDCPYGKKWNVPTDVPQTLGKDRFLENDHDCVLHICNSIKGWQQNVQLRFTAVEYYYSFLMFLQSK